MTQSLKAVAYIPMYYIHMTLPKAGAHATSNFSKFLFHFIGKCNSDKLRCPGTAVI